MRRPAGYYNRKITIRNFAPTPDNAGGLENDAATTLCVRMAHLKSGPGRERQEKLQQHAENVTTFQIPFDSVAASAKPEMTILYAGDVYRITFVEDMDDQHEELQIGAVLRLT